MEFTAEQIAEFLSGKVDGDPKVKVNNVAKIEEGAPGMLSFLANPKYTQYIYETKSSIVIVNDSFVPEKPVEATLIRVPNAYSSFAQLLGLVQQYTQQTKEGVSSLAFIGKNSEYGEQVYLGEFAFVGENVKIGKNVKIYPQVFIGDNCQIGDDSVIYAGAKLYAGTVVGKSCVIHSGAVLGADGFGFAPDENNEYHKIPQIGNVVLEDFVEVGANTTIDRATMGSTFIRRGVKLDNLIQIAHNVELGKNTAIAAQAGVSGSTKVGDNCMFGGQTGVAGHLHIANGVKLAAQSGVGTNLREEGQTYMGSPVVTLKEYKRMMIHSRRFEQILSRVEELEKIIKQNS